MIKNLFLCLLWLYVLTTFYFFGLVSFLPLYVIYLDCIIDIFALYLINYALQGRQHLENVLGNIGLFISGTLMLIVFVLQFFDFISFSLIVVFFDFTLDFLVIFLFMLFYFLQANVENFYHKLGCCLLLVSFLLHLTPFIATSPEFFFVISFFLTLDFFIDNILILLFDNWEDKEFKHRFGIFLLCISFLLHLTPFFLMYLTGDSFTDIDTENLIHDIKNDINFNLFDDIILFILTLVPVLLSVAYFILAERKVIASVQRRKGPNVVGIFGLLQPLIDAVKLLTKEAIIPSKSNRILFIVGPVLTLTIALINWCFIPFSTTNYYLDLEFGLLFFLGFSSISVYGLLISGWASNSKYALMGAIRTVSQFISYEISFGTLLIPVVLLSQSLNFIDIVLWQIKTIWFIIPLWPVALLFFVTILAETNRTPFDLPEAEAELVAGYNTEYASVFFVMFMFAEYSNVLLMSSIFVLLFLGGWSLFFFDLFLFPEIIFSIKVAFIAFIFILIRASYPRLRFDQLMNFGWQRVLPLSLSFIFLSVGMICFVTTFSI